MKLKGVHDTSTKSYTLLHCLTPFVHQKLYDSCAPDKHLFTYEEFSVAYTYILKDYTWSHLSAF